MPLYAKEAQLLAEANQFLSLYDPQEREDAFLDVKSWQAKYQEWLAVYERSVAVNRRLTELHAAGWNGYFESSDVIGIHVTISNDQEGGLFEGRHANDPLVAIKSAIALARQNGWSIS